MRTWIRVLLAFGGASVGAVGCVAGEMFSCSAMSHGPDGRPIDGTGLVMMGLAPFAAILGAIVGVWIALRLTRKRKLTTS